MPLLQGDAGESAERRRSAPHRSEMQALQELHNVRDVKGGVKVIQHHANSRDGGDRDERFAPLKSE